MIVLGLLCLGRHLTFLKIQEMLVYWDGLYCTLTKLHCTASVTGKMLGCVMYRQLWQIAQISQATGSEVALFLPQKTQRVEVLEMFSEK